MKNEIMNKTKEAIYWLFGGNYEYNRTEKFKEIFKKFGSLCKFEQMYIIDVLQGMIEEDINIKNEDVIYNWLEEKYNEEERS